MKKAWGFFIIFFVSVFFFVNLSAFAQPRTGDTAGGIRKQDEVIEKARELERKIEEEKVEPAEVVPEEITEEDVGPKVLIRKITVEGVILLPEKDIEKITSRYEGKELSLKGMQKIADLITDEYRKKGYATSRAYLPPQTIRDGILIIRVVEGTLGKLDIRGNRYFTTPLLEKKIGLKPAQPFDFVELQNSLTRINEHPDRDVKATLVPGKEPGTTDVILEVDDVYPFHIGFEYDNFGSRYIEKDRFSFIIRDNNFLGLDDMLYLEFQRSQSQYYKLAMLRYILPLNNTTEAGLYFIHDKLKLGREFDILQAEGKSVIGGLFFSKVLVNEQDLDIILNLGYDYKDIKNYLLGMESSEDRLRIVKAGLEIDVSDKRGRTLITPEFDAGIPRMFGGLASKESTESSRQGAGGKFYISKLNLFRLQPGPFSSSILWKNQLQFTNYKLVASEQFQIGGPYTVRGYPPVEFTGDRGVYTSFEWSFPPYGISKNIKVPFTDDFFYDAFRTVLFYDWGTARLNGDAMAGQPKHRTLKGCGFGFRLTLTNNLTARIEIGYPLSGKPSDGDNVHQWIEFTKMF